MAVDKDVRAALDTIFAVDSDFYKNRGWNQRSGYGERPALLNIDLANAWTRPGHRFSCNDMDEQIIPGVQRLNAAARAKGVPIIYTPTAFCSRFDMGAFPLKKPFEDLMALAAALEVQALILGCLDHMALSRADSIRSGWSRSMVPTITSPQTIGSFR